MSHFQKEGKKIEEKLNIIRDLIREKLNECGYREKNVGSTTRTSTPFIIQKLNFTKNGFTARIEIYKIED